MSVMFFLACATERIEEIERHRSAFQWCTVLCQVVAVNHLISNEVSSQTVHWQSLQCQIKVVLNIDNSERLKLNTPIDVIRKPCSSHEAWHIQRTLTLLLQPTDFDTVDNTTSDMSHKATEVYSGKNPVPKVALRSILDPSGATEAKARRLVGRNNEDQKKEQDATEMAAKQMSKGEEVQAIVSCSA